MDGAFQNRKNQNKKGHPVKFSDGLISIVFKEAVDRNTPNSLMKFHRVSLAVVTPRQRPNGALAATQTLRQAISRQNYQTLRATWQSPVH